MRNIFISVCILAAGAIFTGCTKNKSGPNTNASVTFVNGCAGVSGMYGKVNGNNVGSSNIAFFGTSGYQTVTAGAENISFYLTGSAAGTLLSTGTPTLVAGNKYSIFIGGIITAPSFTTITDDLAAPASGNAKIRFVNLSSDNLNGRFSVGVQTLDSNITYTHCSPFYEVAAGNYTLKGGGNDISTVATIPSVVLGAGKIYTLMLTGSQSGTATSALTLTVLSNN